MRFACFIKMAQPTNKTLPSMPPDGKRLLIAALSMSLKPLP